MENQRPDTAYIEFGEFEGQLVVLSAEGCAAIHLRDLIFGDIPCAFADDLLPALLSLRGERVSVFGQTRYSGSHLPLWVEVERIERLPKREELPQFEDLEGLSVERGDSCILRDFETALSND